MKRAPGLTDALRGFPGLSRINRPSRARARAVKVPTSARVFCTRAFCDLDRVPRSFLCPIHHVFDLEIVAYSREKRILQRIWTLLNEAENVADGVNLCMTCFCRQKIHTNDTFANKI